MPVPRGIRCPICGVTVNRWVFAGHLMIHGAKKK